LIYLNQLYMFRATNSPILRSTFYYIQLLLQCTDIPAGRQQYRCIVLKAVYTVKSAPEDGRVCRPKHVELIQIDKKDQ